MVEPRNPRQVAVHITPSHPLPPAEGANYFHFTSLGAEVQMLVGTVNLLRMHEALKGEGTATVTPEITHRFILSPIGFAQLKRQIDEISKSVTVPPGVTISAPK